MGTELAKPEQDAKLDLMIGLLEAISKRTKFTYGIKGGSALRLFYGLPRFSEDIDLHGEVPINLIETLVCAAKAYGLKDIEVVSKKSTDYVNRYMLHYSTNLKTNDTLKIECSFRGKWDQKNIVNINGCAVMKLPFIIQGKISALINREKPRDIFDINYLIKNFATDFNRNDIITIYNHINSIGMNDILFNMQKNIRDEKDWILKDIDCEETVLELFQNVQSAMLSEGPK